MPGMNRASSGKETNRGKAQRNRARKIEVPRKAGRKMPNHNEYHYIGVCACARAPAACEGATFFAQRAEVRRELFPHEKDARKGFDNRTQEPFVPDARNAHER